MKTTLILAALLLAGCASDPLELQTGVQCMKTRDGKAAVTDAGIVVLQAGRCTEWRVGPTQRESDAWDRAHATR